MSPLQSESEYCLLDEEHDLLGGTCRRTRVRQAARDMSHHFQRYLEVV